MRLSLLVIAAGLLSLIAHADEPARHTPRQILEHADSLELYSIHPGIYKVYDYTYKSAAGAYADALDAMVEREGVYGSVVVDQPAERAAIAQSIGEGLDAAGPPAGCYDPRHGLIATRDGQRAIFHICFSCNYLVQLSPVAGASRYDTFQDVGELLERLNRLLREAGVPLAREQKDQLPVRAAVTRSPRLDQIAPPALRTTFEQADSLVLYALDPNVYAAWGRGAKSSPAPLASALAALERREGVVFSTSIARASVRADIVGRLWDGLGNTEVTAECYEPRHALVAQHGEQRAVIFLCFACNYACVLDATTERAQLEDYGDRGALAGVLNGIVVRRTALR